jgi:molecular chaperone GrpE (heat shock protein)
VAPKPITKEPNPTNHRPVDRSRSIDFDLQGCVTPRSVHRLHSLQPAFATHRRDDRLLLDTMKIERCSCCWLGMVLLLGATSSSTAFQQPSNVPALSRTSIRHIDSSSPCSSYSASTRLAFGIQPIGSSGPFSSSSSLRSGSDVESDETTTDPSSEVETPPPKKEEEDPELVALKQEISNLESALKAKKRTLLSTKDSVEEYSKQGYARRVAEMENMRRNRSTLNKSNRSYATAAVVTEFVPSYDQLVELKSRYSEMEFAKQYEALAGSLRSSFSELGVQDFMVQAGDKINVDTMNIVEQQQSDDIPKGVVLEVISNRGLELQGNVVRKADVVASLGPVVVEEEEAPKEEGQEEGGPDE